MSQPGASWIPRTIDLDYQMSGDSFCGCWLCGLNTPGYPRRMADFQNPSQIIMVKELYSTVAAQPSYCVDNFDKNHNYHSGGRVYVFADGHVKWLKPSQTTFPVNLWHEKFPPGTPYDLTCNDDYEYE